MLGSPFTAQHPRAEAMQQGSIPSAAQPGSEPIALQPSSCAAEVGSHPHPQQQAASKGIRERSGRSRCTLKDHPGLKRGMAEKGSLGGGKAKKGVRELLARRTTLALLCLGRLTRTLALPSRRASAGVSLGFTCKGREEGNPDTQMKLDVLQGTGSPASPCRLPHRQCKW